jgi:hypothetical protein
MKTVKKFKSIALMMLALGVLFSATLTSCGGKKEEATTEQAEGGEHPEGAEHPTEGGEHPAADSTAKDSTASM